MSNYTQTTLFGPKDALLSGNPAKLIVGAQFDTEYGNIATAIATKYDSTLISAGPVGFANGTSVLPSITFASSTGTGLYLAGAGQLGFSASGTSAAVIYSNGEWLLINNPTSAANQLAGSGYQIGYMDVPLNGQTGANYQFVLSDRGKIIRAGSGFTYTIPANASVPFPIGTTIMVVNGGATACSIAITTDALNQLPGFASGTRTLAGASVATLYKFGTNNWYIWGFGIT